MTGVRFLPVLLLVSLGACAQGGGQHIYHPGDTIAFDFKLDGRSASSFANLSCVLRALQPPGVDQRGYATALSSPAASITAGGTVRVSWKVIDLIADGDYLLDSCAVQLQDGSAGFSYTREELPRLTPVRIENKVRYEKPRITALPPR